MWININDRQPKEGQKVWTYFEITGVEVATYYSEEYATNPET